MSFRSTLVLIFINLALVVALVVAKKRKQDLEFSQMFFREHLDTSAIDTINIRSYEDKFKLVKEDGVWRLTMPYNDQADEGVINDFLEKLDDAEVLNFYKHSEVDFSEVKLDDKNRLMIKLFEKGSKKLEMVCGRESLVEHGTYALVLQPKSFARDVIMLNLNVNIFFPRNLNRLRNQKLVNFDEAKINFISIRNEYGEIQLERKAPGFAWQLKKPLTTHASQTAVKDLFKLISESKVLNFITEEEVLKQNLTFPKSANQIRFAQTSNSNEDMTFIRITKGAEGNDKIFTRVLNRKGVMAVEPSLNKIFNYAPNDFRDKSIVKLNKKLVRLLVINKTEADSIKEVILKKMPDSSWIFGFGGEKLQADPSKVETLIEQINGESVQNFVTNSASDMSKYGLDSPFMNINISVEDKEAHMQEVISNANAGINTNDKSNSKTKMLSILFGKDAKGNIFANKLDTPIVVKMKDTFNDFVNTHRNYWLAPKIIRSSPSRVKYLLLKKKTQAPQQSILLVQNLADSSWQGFNSPLATIENPKNINTNKESEIKINTDNVTELLKTLTELSAIKWLEDSTIAITALQKPDIELVIVIEELDKNSPAQIKKISLAKDPKSDLLFYGRINKSADVFTISPKDFTSLNTNVDE